jgi:cysteine desulfurase
MASLPIYLDHHATTPLDSRVLDAMLPYLREDFGNPASTSHAYGWRAAGAVADAQERIAHALGAPSDSIVFTSGATEANNLAIQGVMRARRDRGHVVTVATEHPAVLDVCRALAAEGAGLTVVPVGRDGLIDVSEFESALRDETIVASVMSANNEIGVLQPIEEIGAICRDRGVLLHTDAAQAAGRIPLVVDDLGVDLLSLSAHKFYGPKGIGALYVRPRTRIKPLLHGGGHQRGLRPGTLPVALCVGMARALDLAEDERERETTRVSALRDRLFARLDAALEGVHRNGHATKRLSGNLNVCFRGVDGDKLLLALTDVAVSSGSACSTESPEPSPVLLAWGLSTADAASSIRFGLGRGTTEEEIDRAAERVIDEVSKLRRT